MQVKNQSSIIILHHDYTTIQQFNIYNYCGLLNAKVIILKNVKYGDRLVVLIILVHMPIQLTITMTVTEY